MDLKLEEKVWWNYIEQDLQELLVLSEFLVNVVKSWRGNMLSGTKVFHDYSFVVFPSAKAYEGFLKKVFLDMGFITNDEYMGNRFRIGKALNPFLDQKYRKNESVYDKLVKYCGGLSAKKQDKELADNLWNTWKNSRNLIFHWFPNEKRAISFEEAKSKIKAIIKTIDMTFKGCKIPS